HLMVAQPSVKGGFTRGSVQYTEAMKLGGDWIAVREFDAEHPLSILFPDPSGERQVYRYVEYRKKGVGSYQDGWLLNTEYFESLAEKWNAILDWLQIPASLYRYKSGSITTQLSEASGIPADMLSAGYLSTGQLKDVGEYEIRFLDADKNEETATGLTVKVLKPGLMLGRFRIIGDTAAPYVHEKALTPVPENGETFFRTLGGMRVHLEASPNDTLEPYIVGYDWSVTPYADYAFPANAITALEQDLKSAKVPQTVIDLLKDRLAGKSFQSRKSVVEAIRPVFMGYAITDDVLITLKAEFERDRKTFPGYLFKDGDGLTVLNNTSYGTQEELFTALGTTDFERSGDNPKRVKGFRVAGYRMTREALTALFEEEVVKNHFLPAHIYKKLAGHEKDRTICSNSCILGKEGEGWSFRNVDA
ncbi:MAG: hypothetical protein GY801_31920, partial [bacterium]|nr:hypothetical protein [bacterium]